VVKATPFPGHFTPGKDSRYPLYNATRHSKVAKCSSGPRNAMTIVPIINRTTMHYIQTKCLKQYNIANKSDINDIYFSPMSLRPHAGQGLLSLQVSRSHKTMHHSR